MATKPHLILIPFPAQGHVAPMMKLAYNLVHHGIKVTFVNTISIHSKIMSARPHNLAENSLLSLVSIPELLESDTRGNDGMDEAAENTSCFLQTQLQNLIENVNELNEDGQVTHVIADVSIGWALKVANQMAIKAIGFLPYGLGNFFFVLQISKLMDTGIIDANGVIKEESISLSQDILAWNTQNLLWKYPFDEEAQKFVFRNYFSNILQDVKCCNTILANTFLQLETAACNLIPNVLPIGPLWNVSGASAGNMWAEDSSCLTWLDQQSSRSVIYAAFGSTVFCSQEQLDELAIGFEMTGRPFLWVVRADFAKETAAKFPEGFKERVGSYGKIVEWAPQEKVLSHPSIACFFSHCGWNSTMEGVSMGVPFLCWPCIVDQFHNKDNICKTWRVGVEVIPEENGIVTRDEIKYKVEKLLCDEDIKANCLKLKEMAEENMRAGGSSFRNFKSFIDQIKE